MTTAIKATLCLSAAALASAACSGPGNTGMSLPDNSPRGLTSQIAWLNGGVPTVAAADPKNPAISVSQRPIYPLLGGPADDQGDIQQKIDCSVLGPYEFAPWVETSEPREAAAALNAGGDPSTLVGLAIRWAGADDMTRGSWRSPGFSTWYPGLVNGDGLLNTLWGTPAQSITDPGTRTNPAADPGYSDPFPPGPVPQCDADPVTHAARPNNNVIHMRGAGFRYYGGNIAHILAGDNYTVVPGTFDASDCPSNPDGSKSDLCHPAPAPGAIVDSAGFPLAPTKNDVAHGAWELGALHTYLDVSKYEGVSFWARRGPDSMGSLLVTIADKHTSDDMNRQNETFCRRIFACHNDCQNYQACTENSNEPNHTGTGFVWRCHGSIPIPGPSSDGASSDLLDAAFPRCTPKSLKYVEGPGGGSACTFRDSYPDADFEGKACRPYTFTSGESAEYCFNAADLPPPSREQRCGDGYTSTLQLTTDWTFYTVPFSDMRQGGYGKISPDLDLTAVYSVTLGWGPGNMDIYMDNVSLYRTKKL